MAMMAAMKKVLSPISDTMMTEKAATKAWKNPTLTHATTPSEPGSSTSTTCERRKRENSKKFDTVLFLENYSSV